MNIPITILTPAYNKGKTIERTYQSLLNQTVFDFEWVLINDGSTDDTLDIIKTFQTDKFPIRFTDKQNEGLNRTFNLGVKQAHGDLILRLDPDDYLTEDAVEKVLQYKKILDTNPHLCSIVFLTKFSTGEIVGYHPYTELHQTNFTDYRIIDKAKGDRLEVVKREVFLEFPMPEIQGEKFCLESYMWQQIAEKYDAIYVPEAIYIREYNEASITSNLAKVLSDNPIGTMLTYSQYIKILSKKKKQGAKVNFEIFKNGINYFRFAFHSHRPLSEILKGVSVSVALLCFPAACLLYIIDAMDINLVYNILFFLRKNRPVKHK